MHDLDPGAPVHRQLEGLSQAPDRASLVAQHRGGPPEPEQQLAARCVRWVLRERAVEIADGGARRPACQRCRSRLVQPSGAPLVTRRRRRGHLGGDGVEARAAFAQQARGSAMKPAVVRRAEVVVDRGPDDGMHEPQHLAGREDLERGQRVCRGAGGVGVQTRELGGELERRVTPEDRDRPGERDGRLADPADPRQDRGGDAVGMEVGDTIGRRCGRLDPVGGERGEQLADELRVPARHPVAGAGESVRRLRLEQGTHVLVGGRLGQRRQAQDPRRVSRSRPRRATRPGIPARSAARPARASRRVPPAGRPDTRGSEATRHRPSARRRPQARAGRPRRCWRSANRAHAERRTTGRAKATTSSGPGPCHPSDRARRSRAAPDARRRTGSARARRRARSGRGPRTAGGRPRTRSRARARLHARRGP